MLNQNLKASQCTPACKEIALCNYYAPTSNKSKEQLDTLDVLQDLISNVHHKLILGGDMNIWLQPHLNKYRNSEMTKTARKMNSILDNLDLIDIGVYSIQTQKDSRGEQEAKKEYNYPD